jgi:hypothetical protein
MYPVFPRRRARRFLAVLGCLWSAAALALTDPAAQALFRSGDVASLQQLGRAAQAGDAAAQNWYALSWYARGDFSHAAIWLARAAAQGHADAQCNLGALYAKGQGVVRDDAIAADWYRKAAAQGNANAQYDLGVAYDKGQGVAQDDAQAAAWYAKAALQGQAKAQNNLGWLYASGRGVARSAAEAAAWYRKAAEQGDAIAQRNLAQMYAQGDGVPLDPAQARHWLTAANARRAAPPAPASASRAAASSASAAGRAAPGSASKGPKRPAASSPGQLAAAPGGPEAGVARALQAWAEAWAVKDLDLYFAAYAPDFSPGAGVSRAAWMAQRRASIEDKPQIEVELSGMQVRMLGGGARAQARFREHYAAGKVRFDGWKTVVLRRLGERWVIVAENS